MTRRFGIGAIALAAACVASAMMTATARAEDAKHPRDPWVFRSVLDGRARMLTCALNEKLYVSYDTQTGSLYRAWAGSVLFTGGVYDARHGPQPKSVGPAYFGRKKDDSAWQVRVDGKPTDAKPHYLGYKVGANDVTLSLAFDTPGGRVTVDESPGCEIADDKVTLVRTFKVSGLPAGTIVALTLSGDEGDASESIVDRGGARMPGLSASDSYTVHLDRNGTVTLRTTWRTR